MSGCGAGGWSGAALTPCDRRPQKGAVRTAARTGPMGLPGGPGIAGPRRGGGGQEPSPALLGRRGPEALSPGPRPSGAWDGPCRAKAPGGRLRVPAAPGRARGLHAPVPRAALRCPLPGPAQDGAPGALPTWTEHVPSTCPPRPR